MDRLLQNITMGPPPAHPGPPRYADPNEIPFDLRIEQLREQGWWSPRQIRELEFSEIFGAFDDPDKTKHKQWIPHSKGVEPPHPSIIGGGNRSTPRSCVGL